MHQRALIGAILNSVTSMFGCDARRFGWACVADYDTCILSLTSPRSAAPRAELDSLTRYAGPIRKCLPLYPNSTDFDQEQFAGISDFWQRFVRDPNFIRATRCRLVSCVMIICVIAGSIIAYYNPLIMPITQMEKLRTRC